MAENTGKIIEFPGNNLHQNESNSGTGSTDEQKKLAAELREEGLEAIAEKVEDTGDEEKSDHSQSEDSQSKLEDIAGKEEKEELTSEELGRLDQVINFMKENKHRKDENQYTVQLAQIMGINPFELKQVSEYAKQGKINDVVRVLGKTGDNIDSFRLKLAKIIQKGSILAIGAAGGLVGGPLFGVIAAGTMTYISQTQLHPSTSLESRVRLKTMINGNTDLIRGMVEQVNKNVQEILEKTVGMEKQFEEKRLEGASEEILVQMQKEIKKNHQLVYDIVNDAKQQIEGLEKRNNDATLNHEQEKWLTDRARFGDRKAAEMLRSHNYGSESIKNELEQKPYQRIDELKESVGMVAPDIKSISSPTQFTDQFGVGGVQEFADNSKDLVNQLYKQAA